MKRHRQCPPHPVEGSWRGILDVVPAAAHTCDAKGLITYFNRIAEAFWGRAANLRNPAQRFCAAHRLLLPDGTPLRHDQCWMARALLDDKAYHDREIVIVRCDGSRTWGRSYAYPLRDRRERIIGAVNLIADVTSTSPQTVPGIPHDATLAMIDIAVSVLAGMRWPATTFE